MSTGKMVGIGGILYGYAYRYSSETQLHKIIAGILDDAHIQYTHEYCLDSSNRVDFWLEDGMLIEVKVDGSYPEAMRQIDRYCALEAVTGVILASTQRWAGRYDGEVQEIHGKPVMVVRLRRQVL